MSRSAKVFAVGGTLAAILLSAAACGSTPVVGPSTKPATKPVAGGVINYAEPPQSNLNWFLPVVNAGFDSIQNFQFIFQMYKPLIWVNANYTIDWKSSIAKKITYNSQGTVYHIELNPKWHWSNGAPVTAQDVLFTWNVIKAASGKNAPAPWPYVGAGTGDIPNGIQSIVANGSHALTITLKKPANQEWFIYNGLIQLIPMPKQAWDVKKNMQQEIAYLGKQGSRPQFDKVVDGPFKIGPTQPNQYWTLVPNKAYDGHKSRVKKVVFTYEGSNTAEFAALKTGTINVGYLDLSQYGSKSQLTRQGDVVTPEYTFGYFETQLNMFPGSPVKSLLDKLYIRQALQMGIDRTAIDKSVYHGFAPPLDGPIPSTPKTSFFDSALNKNPYPYSPSAGKKLLQKHGWHLVNGVMTRNGQTLSFQLDYPTGTESELQQVQLMKSDWGHEGIQVSLHGMSANQLESTTYSPSESKKWQLSTGLAWFYDGPGYWPTGGQLFYSNAPSGFGYSNSQEDKLINATHQPYATKKQSLAAFYRYEYNTAIQLPVLWQNNVGTVAVHAATVHNSVKYADASVGFPQMQYWWVSK